MRLLSLAMMVVSFVSGVSVAADREQWVQWRGNARNCEVSKPVEWPSSLKPEHLKELYRVPLGPSYSGPIVSADRVFVTETVDKKKEVEPQTQLEELNDYLRMLADMDKVGIRRKIVLLEGYINKIKNQIKD